MFRTMFRRAVIFSFCCIAISSASTANGQGQSNVSVVNLGVQVGSDGKQLVLTPKGYLVPLPGAGVNSNFVALYMGSNGGFWYVDRNGKTEDITSYVQQVRAQSASAQQSAPPQYAPAPTYSSSTTSSGSSVGTAAVSAAAAGAGAMVGTAVANNNYYRNVPYGAPMYYGNDGRQYYNDDRGKGVFVDDGQVNLNNVYAGKEVKQNKQKENAQQLSSYRQQQSAAAPQSAGQSNQQNRTQFDQQQQWYQSQRQNQERAQSWQRESAGENPFVRGGSGERGGRASERSLGGGERRGGGGGGRRGR